MDAWQKIEQLQKRLTKEKLPECIKSLLIPAGYDTLASLSQLSDETIKSIEEFHRRNAERVNSLTCCYSDYYKSLNEFSFLPGHRSILLSLPNQIKEIKKNSTNKRSESKKNGAKKSLSDEILRTQLLNSLNKYLRSKTALKTTNDLLSAIHIKEFKRGTGDCVCSCKFSCPFCQKLIPATYKAYWHSSNITSHLKKHN